VRCSAQTSSTPPPATASDSGRGQEDHWARPPTTSSAEIDERLKADPEKLTGTIAKVLVPISAAMTPASITSISTTVRAMPVPVTLTTPTSRFTMDSGDFVDLATGELDGTEAYMSGKITLQGDMGSRCSSRNLLQ